MKPVGAITTFKEIKELARTPGTSFYLLVPSDVVMKMRTTRETKFVNKPELWERNPRITNLLLKHYGYRAFSLSFININMGKNQNEKRCWLFTNYWFAMAYAECRKQELK